MRITSIKIPSEWRDETGRQHFGKAHFQLGPGPCGKTVVKLDFTPAEHLVEVTQVCDDGDVKHFIYPLHTVAGRIEIAKTQNNS